MTSRNRKRGRPVKSPHLSVSVRVLAGHTRDHLSEKGRYMISEMKRLFAELGKNPTRGVRHRGLVRVSPQGLKGRKNVPLMSEPGEDLGLCQGATQSTSGF